VAGVPVVFARRLGRKVGLLKRFNSWAFAKVHAVLGGFKTDAAIGNYSVLARRVVLQLRQFKERTRNYGMHVGWLGFQTEFVDIESAARHSGESTYTLGKQLKHALSTILSQSTRPLYVSAGVGFFFSSSSALYALYLVGRKVMLGVSVEGWTSLMVGLFFLSGVMMVNMGVLGLYLGNVFLDVKGRPTFVVEETTFDEDTVTR
jgi:dolichol-phosphate mannosyltransferase